MAYNKLSDHLQREFGCKVYKLALSGGMSCPNRDGTCGTGGCIFCSGSGEGARYQRWIGPTPYLTRTCSYVMRLKEVVDPPAQ